MKDIFAVIGQIIGLMVLLAVAMLIMVTTISLVTYPILKPKCAEKWHPRMTKYDVVTGCLVAYEGYWVPEDNYIIVEKDGSVSAQLRK